MLLSIIFALILHNAKSDWVEIPQVSNKIYKPGAPKISFVKSNVLTTPASYEVVMRTPSVPKPTESIANTTYTTFPPRDTTTWIPRKSATLPPRSTTSLPLPPVKNKTPPPRRSTSTAPPPLKNKEKTEKKAENRADGNETWKEDAQNGTNYNGFLPLLNRIQETLVHGARKSLRSKLSTLTELRDNLLLNIEDRMGKLYKKDLPEARGHDDHEMDFPSNEGALMTIGFLTFAVFLIKLVMKLIYALKNKHMMMTTTTMAPTAMAAPLFGRKKRETYDDDTLKILQMIDEYKFT